MSTYAPKQSKPSVAKRKPKQTKLVSRPRTTGASSIASNMPWLQGKPAYEHGNGWRPLPAIPSIQPKLKIGEPNDRYEQEADRVADEVMKMPDNESVGLAASKPSSRNTSSSLQRLCKTCAQAEEETLQRKPIQPTGVPISISGLNHPISTRFYFPNQTPLIQRDMEEEEDTLQTKSATSTTPNLSPTTEVKIQSLRGRGQPLSASERGFFEPRFGYNFSPVRIHTDKRAADSAQAIKARAFTLGVATRNHNHSDPQ